MKKDIIYVNMITGTPYFTVLHFITLHKCCISHKLKARPCTGKVVTTYLITVTGTKPRVSPRHACIHIIIVFADISKDMLILFPIILFFLQIGDVIDGIMDIHICFYYTYRHPLREWYTFLDSCVFSASSQVPFLA